MGINESGYLAVTASAEVLFATNVPFGDNLHVDLYGEMDEGRHVVTRVCAAGTKHDLSAMRRDDDRWIESLSSYLDLISDPNPINKVWAARHLSSATSPK